MSFSTLRIVDYSCLDAGSLDVDHVVVGPESAKTQKAASAAKQAAEPVAAQQHFIEMWHGQSQCSLQQNQRFCQQLETHLAGSTGR